MAKRKVETPPNESDRRVNEEKEQRKGQNDKQGNGTSVSFPLSGLGDR